MGLNILKYNLKEKIKSLEKKSLGELKKKKKLRMIKYQINRKKFEPTKKKVKKVTIRRILRLRLNFTMPVRKLQKNLTTKKKVNVNLKKSLRMRLNFLRMVRQL